MVIDGFPVKRTARLDSYRRKAGLWFVIPAFSFIFTFMVYPLLRSFYLSLTEYNFAYDAAPRFVGLRDYVKMCSDPYFVIALKNSLTFAAFFFSSVMVISFMLALLANKPLQASGFFRTAIFLPVVVPLALTGIIFQWILNDDYGLLNYLLVDVLHLPSLARNWLTDQTWAMCSIILISLWKYTGIAFVLYLVGLQAIPRYLYEAASIDGANTFRQLVHITLPQLRETFAVTAMWAILQSLKVFEQSFVMTGGGPGSATLVLYQYSWQNAFQYYDVGYASAIGYSLGLLIFLLFLINLRINRSRA